jgi:hypothetical protein
MHPTVPVAGGTLADHALAIESASFDISTLALPDALHSWILG